MARQRTADHEQQGDAAIQPPQRPRRIVLDCDPGHDDAIAILLAARAPGIRLEAITTVAGNQTAQKTAQNALKVCSLAGIHSIPIARGMEGPLVRELQTAPSIHGASGLDGPALPEPSLSLAPLHAVDLLIELLLASDGDLTIVATGPLTNVATAMRREPRIVPRIQQIVLMGGAIGFGNWTPAAEFNIYVDPEAAHVVFTCGCPLTMIGLDVTHTVLATPRVRARVRALGTPVAHLVDDLLGFFAATYRRVFGFAAPPLHDPCAVAHVVDPTLLRTQPMHVDIELRGEFTAGRTVCDVHGVTGKPANAHVGMQIDVPRFWDLLIDTLATY
jgi:inosine-uridine nucleoside N-ribohydrolase